MSMISSQCDERLDERLRRAAQTCRELGKHTTENVFLEASDTICKLRGENEKLRELVLDLYDAIDSVFWDGEAKTRERFEPRMSELGIEVTNG